MNRTITPPAIAQPAAAYAHAVLSDAPARLLHTAGVVPIAPDGTVPVTPAEQAAVVWGNVAAILEEAGMAAADVVAVTTYVVAVADARQLDLAAIMAARDRFMDGHLAASTLITVPALARPEWLVEVAVVAAS
ncbi:MAG: Rid family hydrolase [Ilumatobacteraceae bacterium]